MLIGIVKLKFVNRLSLRMPIIMKEGIVGSFLLGASFSLAFCPTMFVLFFVWLMPTVLSSSYGFILPAVFGVATSIPLVIIFAFIELFNAKRFILKKSKNIGRIIQKLTGAFLLTIGIFDTITYWGM